MHCAGSMNAEEATIAAESRSSSSGTSDHDFDPSADMLVHDGDDEGTIENEEKLQNPDEIKEELEDLEKESSMPLEQLLALYYGNHGARDNGGPEMVDDLKGSANEGVETSEIADSDSGSSVDASYDPQGVEVDIDPFETQRVTRGVAALNAYYFEDRSSDEDYDPIEEWKKDVQLGEEYQAQVSETLSPYLSGEKTHDFDDKLLWKPDVISEELLKRFLEIVLRSSDSSVRISDRDDEQALYTLLQCGNVEEAVSMRLEQAKQPPQVGLWSEEECQSFEQGLRAFGKDFGLIQRNKVSSRSIGEIVQFYYLWKKTERHDAFVTQSSLGRRKHNIPGIADYMGRFIDESESAVSSRSSSPYTVANQDQHDQAAAGSCSEEARRTNRPETQSAALRLGESDPSSMLQRTEKRDHANLYTKYLQPGYHSHERGPDSAQFRHHGYESDGSQPRHNAERSPPRRSHSNLLHRARTPAKEEATDSLPTFVSPSLGPQVTPLQSPDGLRLGFVPEKIVDAKTENVSQQSKASQELQWRKSPQTLQIVGDN